MKILANAFTRENIVEYEKFKGRWIQASAIDHPDYSSYELAKDVFFGGAFYFAATRADWSLMEALEGMNLSDERLKALTEIFPKIASLVKIEVLSAFFDAGFIAMLDVHIGGSGKAVIMAFTEWLETNSPTLKRPN